MPSISKVFGVPEDYTLEQLKSSYINIIENLTKSDKSEVEKDLLSEQYKKLYKHGKKLYLERVSYDIELEQNENLNNTTNNHLNNHLNNHSNNLYYRFDEFIRWNPFELTPFNFGYEYQRYPRYPRYPSRRLQDPFSTFDSVFGQMMSQMDNLLNMDNSELNNSVNSVNSTNSTNSNTRSQVYSYSSSYRSTSNPDGSRTIIKSKSESKNGDKNKTINAYKKMPDGKTIPLTEEEMKQIENSNHNGLLKN